MVDFKKVEVLVYYQMEYQLDDEGLLEALHGKT
jgi:hypothetical protein